MPHPLYALVSTRERRGLSTRDLATSAGVDIRTVTRLEQGRSPTYTTWRGVARVLDVEPWELLHQDTTYATCPVCAAYRQRLERSTQDTLDD
jgi:transcriptional regulator with XRE-family HTH domain